MEEEPKEGSSKGRTKRSVTLDKTSENSVAKTLPIGDRESLVGVKKSSQSSNLPQVPQDSEQEEEGSEHEREEETDIESHPRLSSSEHEFLPPFEEEIDEYIDLTTPPSSSRHSGEEEQGEDEEEHSVSEMTEDEQQVEDEKEQNGSEMPEEEETLQDENTPPTLIEKECVAPEVVIVWEYICKFIIQKMLQGFAVRVPGLGTFSHVVLPNDVTKKPESGKFPLRKTRKFPVFKICLHLKQVHGLIEENHLYQCNAPIIPLNVSVVASNAKQSRGIVEGIMIETLQSFVTGIITNKDLEFPFPFIGKLYIENRNVFMVFYQQFCEGLSFEFDYAPFYFSSVFPGNMTPLAYHRSATQFHSVFDFCDVRSVEDVISIRSHSNEMLVADNSVVPENYEYAKNLFTHSSLPYDCSCDDKSTKKVANDNNASDRSVNSTPSCGSVKNENDDDMIKKVCSPSTQHGSVVFQKPDGSSFSPELLYKSAKTGDPILDKLAEDGCLLQQAIGCWMKKQVVQTLGVETVAKHHDREYFRQQKNRGSLNTRGYASKNCMFEMSATPTAVVSLNAINSSGSTKVSATTSPEEMSLEEEDLGEEEDEELGEEEGAIFGEVELDFQNTKTSFETKTEQSHSLRDSKEVPQLEEEWGQVDLQKKRKSGSLKQQQFRNSASYDEFEQDE